MTNTIIIIVVVAIVLFILITTLKKTTQNKLVKDLENENFDSFNNHIDSFICKLLFPLFTRNYLKLNAAFIEGNKKKINTLIAEVDKQSISKKQKEDVYMKAFNYYVSVEDKNFSKKYLDKVNELDNEQMKLEANRVYDIFIAKNDKHLENLLKEIEDYPDPQKGVNEYLISVIYGNKGDTKNQEKYKKLSEQHMKLLDEQIAKKMNKK